MNKKGSSVTSKLAMTFSLHDPPLLIFALIRILPPPQMLEISLIVKQMNQVKFFEGFLNCESCFTANPHLDGGKSHMMICR